jgi:hypothetical protein
VFFGIGFTYLSQHNCMSCNGTLRYGAAIQIQSTVIAMQLTRKLSVNYNSLYGNRVFYARRNVTHVQVDSENIIAYLYVSYGVKNTDSRVLQQSENSMRGNDVVQLQFNWVITICVCATPRL